LTKRASALVSCNGGHSKRKFDLVRQKGRNVFFFVWRGWGPLAAVAVFLPLASCAGLMDWNPMVALLTFGIATIAAGVVCRHFGRKWNQGSGFHMMYWIPLEIWGWIYVIVGGLFAILSAGALVKKAIVR
jgi:hypothetical protein